MHDSSSSSSQPGRFPPDDPAGWGELLKRHEDWLKLIARMQIGRGLQSKFDASDAVQQTMLEAYRARPQFRGRTEAEFLAWLRRILARAISRARRHWRGTQRRDAGRERSLDQALEESSRRLAGLATGDGTSPSRRAMRNEQEVLLARALARLPDDYHEVIILRNLQDLPHDEVASRMNRSPGAVRMLWVRALARLREELITDGCS